MRRAYAAAGGAVAKVPAVGQRVAIRVCRCGTVEHDYLTGLTRIRTARIRNRSDVDRRCRDRRRGYGRIAVRLAVIDHEPDFEVSGFRIGVGRHHACRRIAVSEFPGVAEGIAVGVA